MCNHVPGCDKLVCHNPPCYAIPTTTNTGRSFGLLGMRADRNAGHGVSLPRESDPTTKRLVRSSPGHLEWQYGWINVDAPNPVWQIKKPWTATGFPEEKKKEAYLVRTRFALMQGLVMLNLDPSEHQPDRVNKDSWPEVKHDGELTIPLEIPVFKGCSVATDTDCTKDDDCDGIETCVLYPTWKKYDKDHADHAFWKEHRQLFTEYFPDVLDPVPGADDGQPGEQTQRR